MKSDSFLKQPFARFVIYITILCVVYQSAILTKLEDPDSIQILGLLEKTNGFFDYLHKLWGFELLDFQPIRDLTLYLDLWGSKVMGKATYVLQNLFWWAGVGISIDRLTQNLFPTWSVKRRMGLVILFLIYPLFSNILPWGMARKHILSLFFVTFATTVLTRENFRASLGDILRFNICYTLAVLSQPINLLFPFWVLAYLLWEKRLSLKRTLILLSPAFTVFAAVAWVNSLYYEKSAIFKYYYPPKTDAGFIISDKLLAMGHYFFDLFFPYRFTFYPGLGDPSIVIGLIFATVFFFLAYKYVGTKRTLLWGIFIFAPLLIVLTSPAMMFDYYLLVPAVGCYILLMFVTEKLNFHGLVIFGLILAWSSFASLESRHWKSAQSIAETSFRRQPNCLSAYVFIRTGYEIELKADPEARSFLENHECMLGHKKTAYDVAGEITFHSNVLYYEDDQPLAQRLSALGQYGRINFYPQLLKAALELKNGLVEDAHRTLVEFEYFAPSARGLENKYQSGIANLVYPYCLKNEMKKCSEFAEKFTHKKRE